jgi:hypothetical protein
MATPSQGSKKCRICPAVLPVEDFYLKSPDKKTGNRYREAECPACCVKRARRNKDRARRELGNEHLREGDRKRRLAIRTEVMNHYGGFVCVCCGEKEPRFLSLDHVNNDGAAFRRTISGKRTSAGYHTYIVLKRRGYPPGYQVLCMNCNHGKRMNHGVCPHKEQGVTVIPSGSRAEQPETQSAPVAADKLEFHESSFLFQW